MLCITIRYETNENKKHLNRLIYSLEHLALSSSLFVCMGACMLF